jgi:hypothetical protein
MMQMCGSRIPALASRPNPSGRLSRVGYEHVGVRPSRSLENIRDAEFSRSSFDNVTTP